MGGKVIWLPKKTFQEKLLPPPPDQLLSTAFPPAAIENLSHKFANMLKGFRKRATRSSRRDEEQFGVEWTEIINTHIFDVIANRDVMQPSLAGSSSTNWSTSNADAARTTSGPSASTAPLYWQPTLVDKVPEYIMRGSFHKSEDVDEMKDKANAALFTKDVEVEVDGPNWAHQRAWVGFKLSNGKTSNDAFEDGMDKESEGWSDYGDMVRSQLISCAAEIFVYQHRVFVFSFFVIEGEFRALYWDRSGVFVSQKIDYVKDTKALVEMLVGLLVLDDESQGMDITATLLEKDCEDYKAMDAFVSEGGCGIPIISYEEGTSLPSGIPFAHSSNPASAGPSLTASTPETSDPESSSHAGPASIPSPSFLFSHACSYFAKSLKDSVRYRLTVDDEEFLVGKPIFRASCAVGRGTKGFVALHKRSGALVFLKDTWRLFYDGVRAEGEILEDLNAEGVRNIPTVLCHGIVDYQETRVSYYCLVEDQGSNMDRKNEFFAEAEDEEVKKGKRARSNMEDEGKAEEELMEVQHYAHYRTVVKEVCLPLIVFTSSRQLVSIVADCFDAHYDALTKCRIIHHDISSGNILILPAFKRTLNEDGSVGEIQVRWRGMLSDWELSQPIPEDGEHDVTREPERIGTWRYMSVASLTDALHLVGNADEVESFFNVILHNAVRFTPSNFTASEVQAFIRYYFVDRLEGVNDRAFCGPMKQIAMREGKIVFMNKALSFGTNEKPNEPLNKLIKMFLTMFKARYEIRAYEAKVARRAESTVERSDGTPLSTRRRIDGDSPTPACTFDFESPYSELVEPSEETRTYAAHLENHAFVSEKIFRTALGWPWPARDTVRDLLKVKPKRGPGSKSMAVVPDRERSDIISMKEGSRGWRVVTTLPERPKTGS